jgi:hypothetical protein
MDARVSAPFRFVHAAQAFIRGQDRHQENEYPRGHKKTIWSCLIRDSRRISDACDAFFRRVAIPCSTIRPQEPPEKTRAFCVSSCPFCSETSLHQTEILVATLARNSLLHASPTGCSSLRAVAAAARTRDSVHAAKAVTLCTRLSQCPIRYVLELSEALEWHGCCEAGVPKSSRRHAGPRSGTRVARTAKRYFCG